MAFIFIISQQLDKNSTPDPAPSLPASINKGRKGNVRPQSAGHH